MIYDEFLAAMILIAWIPLCNLIGIAAKGYLRSSFAWFLLALFFSPLVTYIFLKIPVCHIVPQYSKKKRNGIKASYRIVPVCATP